MMRGSPLNHIKPFQIGAYALTSKLLIGIEGGGGIDLDKVPAFICPRHIKAEYHLSLMLKVYLLYEAAKLAPHRNLHSAEGDICIGVTVKFCILHGAHPCADKLFYHILTQGGGVNGFIPIHSDGALKLFAESAADSGREAVYACQNLCGGFVPSEPRGNIFIDSFDNPWHFYITVRLYFITDSFSGLRLFRKV